MAPLCLVGLAVSGFVFFAVSQHRNLTKRLRDEESRTLRVSIDLANVEHRLDKAQADNTRLNDLLNSMLRSTRPTLGVGGGGVPIGGGVGGESRGLGHTGSGTTTKASPRKNTSGSSSSVTAKGLSKQKFSEPIWNVWAEASSANVNFEPERMRPHQHYSVVINLAALALDSDAFLRNLGVFHQETKPDSMFAKWLEINKDKKSRDIEVILLPDTIHFESQAPNEFIKHMNIDLEQMREIKEKGFVLDQPPLQYLKQNNGHANFSFGTKPFQIVPIKSGVGWIAFSIWADGLPVTEISYPACIVASDDERCDLPPMAPVSLEGVDLTKLNTHPDAAVQIIDRQRDVVGVFRCNNCNWSNEDYRVWTVATSTDEFAAGIRRVLKRLGNVQLATMRTPAQYRAELHNASEALYNDIFGPISVAGGAETAFAEFLAKARSSVIAGGRTPSLFIRMIPTRPELVLTPVGLLEIKSPDGTPDLTPQHGPYPDFAGFYVEVQIPMRLQDYSPAPTCLSKWIMMVPPDPLPDDESTDYSAVRAARKEISTWIEKFQTRCGDCVKSDLQMQGFEDWVQGMGDEADVVMALSHHDDDFGLFFDETSKRPAIVSDDIVRMFDYPALAILAACGTAEPGGADFVDRFNKNHMRTVIATSNSVEPKLAGRFLSIFLDRIRNESDAYTVSDAWLDSVRRLSSEPDSGGIMPWGPRALEFILIGNGSLRLCSLKD